MENVLKVNLKSDILKIIIIVILPVIDRLGFGSAVHRSAMDGKYVALEGTRPNPLFMHAHRLPPTPSLHWEVDKSFEYSGGSCAPKPPRCCAVAVPWLKGRRCVS